MSALGIAASLGLALLGGALAAQDPKDASSWRLDPYTRNEPAALARAGYVSYGPFTLADGHTSEDVDRILGDVKTLWVETAHFKLGSSLRGHPLPKDKDDRQRVLDELKRLRLRIPGVPVQPRTLDPWLRLHLFAQRLEEQYEEFAQRLQVKETDFPKPGAAATPQNLAPGPYLGLHTKQVVLLTDKASAFGRYQDRYLGKAEDSPRRWNFTDRTLFFGTAAEYAEGTLRNDDAMHAHVAFNMAHNLLDAFAGYFYDLPAWFEEGLAHWYNRRIDPRWNYYSAARDSEVLQRTEWDWAPKVRARAGVGAFRPATELLTLPGPEALDFADHMCTWSRVDFLLGLGDEKLARFVRSMKVLRPEPGKLVEPAQVQARQLIALRDAYGFDPPGFDEAWRKWVLSRPAK